MTVEFAEISAQLDAEPAEAILSYAAERFAGKLTFATGFGAEGCLIVDMVARNKLAVDFFTLDTGVLFPETYELWRRLEAKYGVTIRAVKPKRSIEEQAADEGPKLWEREADRCCNLRKVQPLTAELKKFDAWITAIRRDQTPERANAQVVERDKKFGLVKVNPLVRWTHKQVWDYIVRHDVPYNPLHDQGYPSIGCEPCTSSVADGEDPRAGRWRGTAKKECGLHTAPSASGQSAQQSPPLTTLMIGA